MNNYGTAVVCAWQELGVCYTFAVSGGSAFPSEASWELKSGITVVGAGEVPGSVSTCSEPTSPPSRSPMPSATAEPTPSPSAPCDIYFGGDSDHFTNYFGTYSFAGPDQASGRTCTRERDAHTMTRTVPFVFDPAHHHTRHTARTGFLTS